MTDSPRGAEFDLIERIRLRVIQRDDVILGIGDDAAIVQVPPGKQLVVATDTLNRGVHFPKDTAAADIGWKALAVNLSDLAAMGAQPAWCTLSLSLSLPHSDAAWLDGFLDGFLALAALHRVALIGGDTTCGPLSVCVTVHGLVEPGRVLRRDAARVGDDIWVSGTLGDAAGALRLLRPLPLAGEEARSGGTAAYAGERPEAAPKGWNEGWVEGTQPAGEPSPQPLCRAPKEVRFGHARESGLESLRSRLDRPTPRIELGLALAGLAHAGIDVSDGLLADLGHICRASHVAADVQLGALPMSEALRAAFEADSRQVLQATGGDDYELCFTASPAARARIAAVGIETATATSRIGRIVAGEGVRAFDREGRRWQPARAGYVHFDG